MNEFEKTLGIVMKEILARPDKFILARNFYNKNTITVVVYRENVAIEIVVESNGAIKVVTDEQLINKADYEKELKRFSCNNKERENQSTVTYGYTERDKFIKDFSQM